LGKAKPRREAPQVYFRTGTPRLLEGNLAPLTAGEEETPAGRSKGGAGAKLLVETLMSEKNTPDGLRPGPTDDPRIDSLDKDSIRKREPLAACAAAVLFKRGSTRS